MWNRLLEDTLDNVDAEIFTGDGFHNTEDIEMLKFYLDRWNREYLVIKQMLAELELETNDGN